MARNRRPAAAPVLSSTWAPGRGPLMGPPGRGPPGRGAAKRIRVRLRTTRSRNTRCCSRTTRSRNTRCCSRTTRSRTRTRGTRGREGPPGRGTRGTRGPPGRGTTPMGTSCGRKNETLAVHPRNFQRFALVPLGRRCPPNLSFSMLSTTISRCREIACSLAFVQGADNYNFVWTVV